jgi:hypothetical protein
MSEQKVIIAYINHHFPLPDKFTLTDLYAYLLNGHIFWKEDVEHDQKITITIEVEE